MRADFLEILESHRFPDFQNISKNSETSKIFKMARPSGQDFPKHKGRLFGNFGIEFGRADRHPSDGRPCTTTQLRGHGLSTGGGRPTIHIYIYIYVYVCMYVCIYVCHIYIYIILYYIILYYIILCYPPTPLGRRPEVRLASASVP